MFSNLLSSKAPPTLINPGPINPPFGPSKIIELSQEIPPENQMSIVEQLRRESHPDNIKLLASAVHGFVSKNPADGVVGELGKLLRKGGTLNTFAATKAFHGCTAPEAFTIMTDALLSSSMPGPGNSRSMSYWTQNLASALNGSLKKFQDPQTVERLLTALDLNESEATYSHTYVLAALHGIKDEKVQAKLRMLAIDPKQKEQVRAQASKGIV